MVFLMGQSSFEEIFPQNRPTKWHPFLLRLINKSSRKILIEKLVNEKNLSVTRPGLMMFANYPINILNELIFDPCVAGSLSNCRARKGALL